MMEIRTLPVCRCILCGCFILLVSHIRGFFLFFKTSVSVCAQKRVEDSEIKVDPLESVFNTHPKL